MKPAKKLLIGVLVSICYLFAGAHSGFALDVGQPAPDFELQSTDGGKLKLSSLKGKNVLINFYTLDFSPT